MFRFFYFYLLHREFLKLINSRKLQYFLPPQKIIGKYCIKSLLYLFRQRVICLCRWKIDLSLTGIGTKYKTILRYMVQLLPLNCSFLQRIERGLLVHKITEWLCSNNCFFWKRHVMCIFLSPSLEVNAGSMWKNQTTFFQTQNPLHAEMLLCEGIHICLHQMTMQKAQKISKYK